MQGRKFRHNWKVSIFSALCLVVFANLGFWQLQRQDEKEALLAERETRLMQAPVAALELESFDQVLGLPLGLSGHYREDVTLLLDNVVLEGRVGFEVHQLFSDLSGRQFLVNRGFAAMGRTRQDPVDIPPTGTEDLQIVGVIYEREGAPLSPVDSDDVFRAFPAIVQQIDIAALEKKLSIELYPHVIRLGVDQPTALPRFWPDSVMPPEKHLGYAIQWFTMAIAVVIAWLFFSYRREEDE